MNKCNFFKIIYNNYFNLKKKFLLRIYLLMYNYITSWYNTAAETVSSKQEPNKNEGKKNGGELTIKKNETKGDELN
jgi:hypothetical protein